MAVAAEMRGQIEDAQAAIRFIFAGNARFTLVSQKTGTRFTYRVKTLKPRPQRIDYTSTVSMADLVKDGPDAFNKRPALPSKSSPRPSYISVLTGPDNTASYSELGRIMRTSTGYDIAPTEHAQIRKDAPSSKAVLYALRHLADGRMAPQLEMWHEGRCGRCGRVLTVPESVAAGIGPECAKK